MEIVELAIKAWQFWLAVAGLAAVIGRLWIQIMAFRRGLTALLRDRIYHSYNKYEDKGYCPIYARENLESLYVQYHKLGGNGTITGLYEKLMTLPTEAPDAGN